MSKQHLSIVASDIEYEAFTRLFEAELQKNIKILSQILLENRFADLEPIVQNLKDETILQYSIKHPDNIYIMAGILLEKSAEHDLRRLPLEEVINKIKLYCLANKLISQDFATKYVDNYTLRKDNEDQQLIIKILSVDTTNTIN